MGSWEDFDTTSIIRVFTNKSKAEVFSTICNEYSKTYPIEPDLDSDAECDRYEEEFSKWKNNHPAGPNNAIQIVDFGPMGHSGYYVKEVELV